ncbi:DUF7344 domain-containing protein [Haloprofundus salilacus]|uniref:DUF7344 domain-containing protein n=1 Tax=Haloprofundus salilacus TaxID=2876190 RepID=UPI001CCA4873|nr:hypothetical protein [Haloprofundus salilacus]
MDDPQNRLPVLDLLLTALSDPTRRRVLTFVNRVAPDGEEVYTERLIAEVGTENDREQLYHVHLPELDRAGFVDWDRENEVVRPGVLFDEATPLLDLVERNRDELPYEWP